MTSPFREFLKTTYEAGPDRVGDFVSSSFVFVRISQRWWRGYRKAKNVDVTIDGDAVKDDLMTNPSWKLAPKEMIQEFQAFSTGVDQAVRQYAFAPKKADDSVEGAAAMVLVGGGRYMVDAVVWPRLESYLKKTARSWGEAADQWFTMDGYDRMLAKLKDQHGEAYEKIQRLVPSREALRSKFSLDYRIAPVKIVSDEDTDVAASEGRREELLDLLDLAVRAPREEFADAADELAGKLAVGNEAGEWTALKPLRKARGSEKMVEGARGLRTETILAFRREIESLDRAKRYFDPQVSWAQTKLRSEFPDDKTAARTIADTLSSDDLEAVRVAKLLKSAAEAARDEKGMCDGLQSALGGRI